MDWYNRVAWSEGMFLRAQHFQQLDRYVERLLRARIGDLGPYPWGFSEFQPDPEALAVGKFGLGRARGAFPDGTTFAIPDDTQHPAAIDIPDNTHNAKVLLAVPARQPGGTEMGTADGGDMVTRYAIGEFEATDAVAGGTGVARIAVARLRLRYALEGEALAGYVTMPVARVVEVRADKSVVLDTRFIPPTLSCAASPTLAGFVAELLGLARARAEALAGRMADIGTQNMGQYSDLMMLQALNGFELQLAHMSQLSGVHPERFYTFTLDMLGQLCTFTASRKRPPQLPRYRHDDLQVTFAPVMSELRQALSAVLEQGATQLDLKEVRYGIKVAQINEPTLIRSGSLVLAVHADVSADMLLNRFPAQTTIGATDKIRDLINTAVPGIPLRALPTAPRALPYHSGFSYFELERGTPHWDALTERGAIALHVAGEYPGLELELWAIRAEERRR